MHSFSETFSNVRRPPERLIDEPFAAFKLGLTEATSNSSAAKHGSLHAAAAARQIRRMAFVLSIGIASIYAQSFATASIKPNHNYDQAGMLKPLPGGLSAQNLSVKFCIQWAWNLEEYEVAIPASLQAASELHYDIAAKADGPATAAQVRSMLQALLMERFHLAVHSEKRDMPVFALTTAKNGPKKLSSPTPDNVPHMDLDSSHTEGGQHWLFHNEPVAALIGLISNGLSRPVIDRTGIQGSFDFTFVLPPWDRTEGSIGDHMVSNVFPELTSQLGLRIENQSAELDTLIIDHIDKTPTEN